MTLVSYTVRNRVAYVELCNSDRGNPVNQAMLDDLADSLHRVISELHRMDAIVVSIVRGPAAGAGVALAAAADIVLASTSAKFTLAYTKIGFSPDGGTSLMTASLGLHRMLALALLNTELSGEDARAAGLVTGLYSGQNLNAGVAETVRKLRAGSREAQVMAKRLLREQALPDEDAALRRETLTIRAQAASADGREGVAAFLGKRAAHFPSSAVTMSAQDGAPVPPT
ncbi:enoyl-CoA hydratase/isomerase family protein [Hoyosella subflava]|uniref:Enoyl-CoA hydratase/isomerase n=1 Tax=Hoyosella subflava (strain DSM 45089 / JCM 17490 / NBRC 109087 / DQS3-9A1) TaxID=443218 RepID=F6EMZ6_HOYSD|nr:enoyl-CoA hydratase-related protein [Hoyosella subflava]AEF42888.1 Enoyl-CoA hydratase/isomerase [Hoyosella subflava DQS3-9A1]